MRRTSSYNVFRLRFSSHLRALSCFLRIVFLFFSFRIVAYRCFLSEASKPHYGVWGRSITSFLFQIALIFDLSSRFWDDLVIMFYRRVICIYLRLFRVGYCDGKAYLPYRNEHTEWESCMVTRIRRALGIFCMGILASAYHISFGRRLGRVVFLTKPTLAHSSYLPFSQLLCGATLRSS